RRWPSAFTAPCARASRTSTYDQRDLAPAVARPGRVEAQAREVPVAVEPAPGNGSRLGDRSHERGGLGGDVDRDDAALPHGAMVGKGRGAIKGPCARGGTSPVA